MELLSLIITVGFFLILLSFFCKYHLNFKKKAAGFPFMNTWSYLIHNQVSGKITKAIPLNNVLFEKLIRTAKQYTEEGIFMTFWTRPVLFIYNPEAIKFFINEKAARDKPTEYQLLEDVLGAGIGTSNEERWRSHRKVMNPAFKLGILNKKTPIFNEQAMDLVKDLKKFAGKQSVSIIDILKIHYFMSINEFLTGAKKIEENVNFQMMANYVDFLSQTAVQRLFHPWLIPKLTLSLFPSGRKYNNRLKACNDYIMQKILSVKKTVSLDIMKDDKKFGIDFSKSLTYLLLHHHLNDPTFTIEDVHHEVKTIIATGYDTLSYTTMWCLFLLGLHPEVQEKAFSEIQSKTSYHITPEECNDLTYLEAVIKETLRLYPTVPIYLRNITEDVQYEKYKVYKGTTIAFFPYMLHRNPALYPDPEHFKPERFLNEELKTANSFLPFGYGSRICIGKNYAMLEIKIFLSHILRNFKFISLDKWEDVKPCWSVVIVPAKPLQMQIMQRSS